LEGRETVDGEEEEMVVTAEKEKAKERAREE